MLRTMADCMIRFRATDRKRARAKLICPEDTYVNAVTLSVAMSIIEMSA